MTAQFSGIILSIAAIAAPAGCDRNPPATPTSPAASGGTVRTGTAIIQGTITLAGTPPVLPPIPNQPCHAGAGPLPDETVVVDSAGHLQNVIVYLEDAPPAPPAGNLSPVTLDQVNCHYVPHVLAMRVGQSLHVTSSDATLHNIHGLCVDNEPFNFALIATGQSKDLSFNLPELFQIRCDVHPWMKAYVHVFSHPYFSVTGPTGMFGIHGVPSGTVTLVAWHEKYGELRTKITVADGQMVTIPLTFQSH